MMPFSGDQSLPHNNSSPNKPIAMPPPSRSLDFRPTDIKEKKIALLAVISFIDANTAPYSRGKLYEYFDVNERTARKWIEAYTSASPTQQAPHPDNAPTNVGPRGTKRSHSEDVIAELLSSTVKSSCEKPSAASRQKAGGQGQKKRKMKEEASTPSPSPPQQLLTPPRRKISQPRKRRQNTESSFDFGVEDSDECVEA